ncbi:hypothetical protein ASC90_23835 [Rhizobium sp. Root1220]|nr:hypothetical protein ASC90_23835 [Rhizobium sp. Root1220]
MPKRATKSQSGEFAGAFPLGKVAGAIAASIVASGFVRRLPLGRVLAAAVPILIAALQKNDKARRK